MDQSTEMIRIGESGEGGKTPVPNWLLDQAMPKLRDTELRVLLVIVRQTLGWQALDDQSRRKERDWLTQSQLMRRTGRASEALSRAVDGLVRGGLIDVLNREGVPLTTPAERRRHLGRIYYRLRPGTNALQDVSRRPKVEYAKPNTTKESRYKNIKAKDQIVDKPVGKPFVIRSGRWERVTYLGRTRWE